MSKLNLSLHENQFGEFKEDQPDVIRAISELTFGTFSSPGAIQDQPECAIHIDTNLFRTESSSESDVNVMDLISRMKKFITHYVEPNVNVIVEYQGMDDGIIILAIKVQGNEDGDNKYLYGIGYDEVNDKFKTNIIKN